MQNIVTVEFRTENKAHSALEELKKEQETYGYKIMPIGLVKKENGVDTLLQDSISRKEKARPLR